MHILAESRMAVKQPFHLSPRKLLPRHTRQNQACRKQAKEDGHYEVTSSRYWTSGSAFGRRHHTTMMEIAADEILNNQGAKMENKISVPQAQPARPGRGIETMFKLAVIFLGAFVLAVTLLVVGRMAIYKIHPYERGLHLRGGMYLGTDQPGWHAQIPFWDTVIIVKVNERLGYVDQIAANTADDLSMIVSLQFTYRVTDPARYALDVDDPERILFEFVQGRLRDVVNTKTMADMMRSRAGFSDEIMTQLRTKEAQYGVQFVTVQIQSAQPPEEVVKAIKDRMVAQQKKEQADAEAAQLHTQADGEYYAAQKRADAQAYQIKQIAAAQQDSIRMLLSELSQHPTIANKYLDYMMAQELKSNSKWVIGGGSNPILDLRGTEPITPTLP
jgi:modulator of FtsH protease HflK